MSILGDKRLVPKKVQTYIYIIDTTTDHITPYCNKVRSYPYRAVVRGAGGGGRGGGGAGGLEDQNHICYNHDSTKQMSEVTLLKSGKCTQTHNRQVRQFFSSYTELIWTSDEQ